MSSAAEGMMGKGKKGRKEGKEGPLLHSLVSPVKEPDAHLYDAGRCSRAGLMAGLASLAFYTYVDYA